MKGIDMFGVVMVLLLAAALMVVCVMPASAEGAAGAKKAKATPGKEKVWRVWGGKSAYPTKVLMLGRRKYCYVDEGAGRTIVLVRNVPFGCERMWDLQIPALANAGYRVVSPFRAGTGGSGFRKRVSVTSESEDTFALLDHLGIKKVVVLGRCQGARVARQMLLARPRAVVAFVNYESGTFGRIRWYSKEAVFTINRPKPFLTAPTRALWRKNRRKLADMNRLFDYPGDYNVEYAVRNKEFDRKNADLCRKTALRPDPADLPTPEGKYCKIPVLSISTGWGRVNQQDPMVLQRQRGAAAVNVKLVIIPESGHHPNEEQPDVFNKILIDFMGSLPPRRAKVAKSTRR